MPKKNGVTKTFSFDKTVVDMLDDMCKVERRTQTNLIELLIIDRYKAMKGEYLDNEYSGERMMLYGKTTN